MGDQFNNYGYWQPVTERQDGVRVGSNCCLVVIRRKRKEKK